MCFKQKITNIFQLFCFTNANVIIIFNFLQVVLQGSYRGKFPDQL